MDILSGGEHKLKIARYLFDTHGPKVVFFGRFISLLIGGAAGLISAAALPILRRQTGRLAPSAEAGYPGPLN